MLVRQQFGRRHHRHLVPGFDRDQTGERGDDGLARTDVTLYQALHGVRQREVG